MSHNEKYNKEDLINMNSVHIEQKKRKLLYIGVACIVSVIVIMWAWNMIILIYNTTSQSPPSASVDTFKESIQDVLDRNDLPL